MIVSCTRCQAKFRVADQKVGPRGAKVRCSRCQNVFVVHPELGSMPAEVSPPEPASDPQVDLESSAGAPGSPFAVPQSYPGPEPPPPLPPQGPSPPPNDPFGAAGNGERAEPDPFAAPADPFQPPQGDPFATAGPLEPPGSPALDRSDPFLPGPSGGSLPVTDLSDLGIGAPAEALAPPPPHPEIPPGPPPLAVQFPEDDGLSLEERTTPMPRPALSSAPFTFDSEAFGGPAAGDPFAAGAAFDSGPYELGGQAQGLALSNEPAEPAAEPEGRSPALPPPPAPAPSAPARRAARAADGAAPAAVAERAPQKGGSRVRAIAVNAVGLAALLLAALSILAVWRNEGRLDASALRPAALLGIVRKDAAAGPFTTRDVTSGLYERDRAPPLLFVRGTVVSRDPEVVPGVRIAVEVLRDGRVIARGEARAGAVPTPEELHRAGDPRRLEEVARAAAPRAPAQVKQGDEVPFLVVMDDPPEDLHGATLRLEARAAEPLAPSGISRGAPGGGTP